MHKWSKIFLTIAIFTSVGAGVYLNIQEQNAVDQTKIPSKVEDSRGFQRWITNLKNKDVEIKGDDFKLLEENEIYNTKWVKVYSIEEPGKREEFENNIESHRDTKMVVFSPSDRQYIDYRNVIRDGYQPNEVHHYGLRDDKVIDSRIVDCSLRANCYFDRAWFLDNDVFVVTEISRNIDKKDSETALCNTNEKCMYTFKIHVIDLVINSRLVYESKPFEAILDELKPEL